MKSLKICFPTNNDDSAVQGIVHLPKGKFPPWTCRQWQLLPNQVQELSLECWTNPLTGLEGHSWSVQMVNVNQTETQRSDMVAIQFTSLDKRTRCPWATSLTSETVPNNTFLRSCDYTIMLIMREKKTHYLLFENWMHPICENLNPFNPKKLCAKFGWIWLSGSGGEEDF